MRFAALETSTEWCSVALWRDGEIAGVERRAGNRHSELALPMLENLLKRTNSSVGELDAVAFGAGPGRVHRPADRLRPRAGARVSPAACR